MTIEEVLWLEESQIFDRKSINIEPKALAIPIIAFANADGGDIVIGISDKKRHIEGDLFRDASVNQCLHCRRVLSPCIHKLHIQELFHGSNCLLPVLSPADPVIT